MRDLSSLQPSYPSPLPLESSKNSDEHTDMDRRINREGRKEGKGIGVGRGRGGTVARAMSAEL